MRALPRRTKFVSGTGLPFNVAKVVRHNNVVTNGPLGGIKETIGAFIMAKAASVDEAVEFARGSPGVTRGRAIQFEVRKNCQKRWRSLKHID